MAESAMLRQGSERAYILAGDARFTLVSKRTGQRFTYRVEHVEGTEMFPGDKWFVSVLTGPNNSEDYTYAGTIFASGKFRHTRNSKIDATAPSFVAFDWAWRNIERLDGRVEVWHLGCCSRCGRDLTDPESIAIGLGPICAGKAA